MRTRKLHIALHVAAFAVVAVFLAGTLLIAQRPLVQPAMAKGVVKTQPKDDSSGKKDDDRTQTEQRKDDSDTSRTPTETRRDDDTSSDRDDRVIERRDERRDERVEEDRESSPGRRGEGTRDVRGQVEKRTERRDPEYEFRKHYRDRFFYPYDHKLYSSYPYYNRGTVIIIEQDTWDRGRLRWRRSYEYSDPLPGSLEEALVDIEATWLEKEPEFLMWHIDHMGRVDIYRDGKYSHSLTPRQIFQLTAQALTRIRTIEFRFTSVDKHGFSARAKARHEYRGPDGRRRAARLTYYLQKVRSRWVIERIDIRDSYGSSKCFIATAAFGTPMEEEVQVLRRFRDSYLLTNRPGRAFVAVYYEASPPIARCIEGSEPARAVVRAWLKPVVQLCKLVVPKAAT